MSVSIISMVGGKNGTARTPICVLLRGNTSDGTSTTTMKVSLYKGYTSIESSFLDLSHSFTIFFNNKQEKLYKSSN